MVVVTLSLPPPLQGLAATSQSDPWGLIPASIASNDLVQLTRKLISPHTTKGRTRPSLLDFEKETLLRDMFFN